MKTEELEKYAELLYKKIDDPFNGFGIYGAKIFSENNKLGLFKIEKYNVDSKDTDTDIYEAIHSLHMDKLHLHYSKVIFCTSGWAAPINNDDYIAPSKSPNRKRVCASVVLDIDNKNIVGTFMKFRNEDEIVYEEEATGLLAHAILRLVK